MEVEKTRETLIKFLRARPFVPIEVRLNNGEYFVLDNPQQMAFHPKPNSTSRFIVLDDKRAVSGRLDSVLSIVLIDNDVLPSLDEQ